MSIRRQPESEKKRSGFERLAGSRDDKMEFVWQESEKKRSGFERLAGENPVL